MSSRYSVTRKLNVDKSLVCCVLCKQVCKGNRSLKSHITQMHTSVDKDTSNRGRPHGIPAWNKGLTKENNEIVKQYSKSLQGKPGTFTGKTHTPETRKRISKKLSVNNKGGRCKWYEVSGQKVQGTWERNVALKLDKMNIKWKKLKTNRHTFLYSIDGKERCYTPDFYLPQYNIYLEIKGYWWGNDREKMNVVLEKYSDTKIVIIEKDDYKRLLDGELVW